jgi:RND family efflux transporter MFP subunit
MSKKLLAVLIVILVVVALTLAVVRKEWQLAHLPPPANPPMPVVTAQVTEGQASNTVATVALVQSETSATVSAEVAGSLLEVRFHEGDAVKKGEVMALIDPRTFDDAVQAAEARVTAAEEDYAKQKAIFDRDKVLVTGGAIAQQAFDISKAQLAGVEAARVTAARALQSARVYRSYCTVPAPYSGVVTGRLAEPGDLAAPGKPLYTLQIPGAVKVLSKLSQDQLARLRVRDTVIFQNGGQTLETATTRIYPALDAAHLGSVETDLKQPPFGLPSGATVAASYAAAPVRGLLVPNDALLEGIEKTTVVKVEQGKAQPVPVRVLGRGEKESALAAGEALKAGDVLIVGLPSELMALTAGTPVAPQGGGQR